ncbi:MAG: carbohydrate binding family 9 domain-containing protein [Acidobacteria bacterium]|nr:carbohydrate binding family 9 domain-containing protein [Acidobacteriota bacterium]
MKAMTRMWRASMALPLIICSLAAGQDTQPSIAVPKATTSLSIDGDLADPAWREAAVIDTFYETSPGENVPPTVKTIAYVTYDEKSFYIGLLCEDPEPSKIRAPYVDRDNVIGTDDNVAIFLDTRNDRRSAIEFRVNPRGIQGDAMYNDANGNEDFSPDFFYDTAARVTETGWTAELRIPFSSLRYPKAETQSWGILIWRNYPRQFRYMIHSSTIPRGSNCWICRSIKLTGLTGLPSGGNLVAAPYASARESGHPRAGLGSAFVNEPIEGDGGIDVKWTPNANTAIDGAVNPDFSQVESDVGQIAVNNRFALFFPEKRPFFLESVDLFDMPILAVYTRTITSPRWGVRATGKFSSSSYTVLSSEDRGGGSVILPGATFSDFAPQDFRSFVTIGRLRQDFGDSFGGVLFSDREIDGGGYNRVFGPDFQFRPSGTDQITGQLLISDTRTPDMPEADPRWDGRRLTSAALQVMWLHTSERWVWRITHENFGDDFRADNGFVPQVGYRMQRVFLGYTFYPKGLFNRIQTLAVVRFLTDSHGAVISRRTFPGVQFQGRKNLVGEVDVFLKEQVRVDEKLLEITNVAFFAQVDPSQRISRVGLNGWLGEDVDFAHRRVGRGGQIDLFGTIKPTDHLQLEINGSQQWLNVDGAAGRSGRLFTARIERLKATYNFTSRALLRLIGEYFRVDRDPDLYEFEVPQTGGSFAGSALFSYKLNWQTVLFVGYGDNRVLTEREVLEPAGRELFLKVSYAFQH